MRKTLLIFVSLLLLISCSKSKTDIIPKIEKDPNDFTLTESSTAWDNDHYCFTCFSTIDNLESLNGICNKCGTQEDLYQRFYNNKRTFRQIYKDKKWVWQYKYPYKSVISDSKLHD